MLRSMFRGMRTLPSPFVGDAAARYGRAGYHGVMRGLRDVHPLALGDDGQAQCNLLAMGLSTTSVSPHAADTRLLLAARGVRAFAYGIPGVLLGVALTQRGLSPVAIGAIITVSLA